MISTVEAVNCHKKWFNTYVCMTSVIGEVTSGILKFLYLRNEEHQESLSNEEGERTSLSCNKQIIPMTLEILLPAPRGGSDSRRQLGCSESWCSSWYKTMFGLTHVPRRISIVDVVLVVHIRSFQRLNQLIKTSCRTCAAFPWENHSPQKPIRCWKHRPHLSTSRMLWFYLSQLGL